MCASGRAVMCCSDLENLHPLKEHIKEDKPTLTQEQQRFTLIYSISERSLFFICIHYAYMVYLLSFLWTTSPVLKCIG